MELGETMADNLVAKGVTASASDGLTTLAGKILDIQTGGSCYHIEFSEASYTAFGGSATLEIYLQENYAPKSGASVTVTGSDGSVYTGITNTNGLASVTVTNISVDTTFTATYSNVTATCTVNVATYLFYDGGVTGDYNSNYGKTVSGVSANVTSNGTTVSSSNYSDCYYYENVLIQGDFRATATIVAVTKYGGLAFLNSSKSRQWFVECNIADSNGWGWDSSDGNIFDSSISMPRKLTLERIGTTLKIYMDDVLKRTETVNTADGYLGWKTHSHSSRSITFKDFSIISL